MKKVNILVTGRFFITFSVSLAIGFGANWFNHKSYYETRNGVQSVDLNILTNTLPTKLSDSLKRKDLVEIQQTISSNYGFFGLVVTDCNKSEKYCENQKILAISQPEREGWREKVRPENLVQFQYDILRDSLPITSEWQFNNDEAMSVIPTGRENKGKPIGRVYYIRRDPPTLIQNHLDWMWIPIESFQIFREKGDLGKSWKTLSSFWGSGANKYYSLTYLLCLVTASLIWRIWEENNHQKEQVVYQKTRLNNLSKQTNRTINNLGNQIQNLQGDLQQTSIDAEDLRAKLSDTENLLEQKERETSYLSSQVKDLFNGLDIAGKDRDSYKIELELANKNIQDTLSNIQLLEDNLKVTEISNQGDAQNIEKLRQEISNAYKYINTEKQVASKLGEELEKSKLNYTSIQQKLNNAENNLERNQDEINSLNQKLKDQSDKQQEYRRVIQELRLKNESLVDQQVNLETKNDNLKSSLSKKSEKLREELRREYDDQVDSLCNSIDLENKSLREENKSLREKSNNLIIEQEYQEPTLFIIPHLSSEEESVSEVDNKFDQSLQTLLPNLVFLRNSTQFMDTKSNSIVFLLARLKAINDGDFTNCIKVRATANEWLECRVPHMSMMRIYFQKCKSVNGKYQVLISPKKDDKTQNKDFEWLKQQPI